MTPLQSYQKWVLKGSFDPFAHTRNTGELMYLGLSLTGESGEFAEDVKKLVREHGYDAMNMLTDQQRQKLILEAGDVQWYLMRICSLLQITPEELIDANIEKLTTRHGGAEPDVRFD